MMLLVLVPLGFFAIQLDQAGRLAKREFGDSGKPLRRRFPPQMGPGWKQDGEPLLGTSDIQSLADMANSYSVVSEIRLFPITKQALIRLVVIMICLPLAPLISDHVSPGRGHPAPVQTDGLIFRPGLRIRNQGLYHR